MTTIANSGTCYNLTLIDKVTDYEGNVILDNHAEVKNQVQLASSTWDAVHQGMRNVVAYSAGSDELINRINVHVAGKPEPRRRVKTSQITRYLYPTHHMKVRKYP